MRNSILINSLLGIDKHLFYPRIFTYLILMRFVYLYKENWKKKINKLGPSCGKLKIR